MNDTISNTALRYDDFRQAEVATAIVSDILAGTGLVADVSYSQEGREILIDVTGDDLGFAIGRRAQTLDAIQLLAYLISCKAVDPEERRRVSVDIDEYRAAREEELFDLADRAVRDAISSGQTVEMKRRTRASISRHTSPWAFMRMATRRSCASTILRIISATS